MLDASSNRISSPQLFLIFSRIGLTSFGGGLSGWLLREFVQSRKWLTEEEFFSGLAISQAMPGINMTNVAIWIGYRLRVNSGAKLSWDHRVTGHVDGVGRYPFRFAAGIRYHSHRP